MQFNLPERIESASRKAGYYFSKYTLPLGLKFNKRNNPWDEMFRATFTLINTGARHVFVSCSHVAEKILELQQVDSDAQIVAYLIETSQVMELFGFTLIDCEKASLDVAIFTGLENWIRIPGRRFIDYQNLYCRDISQGDAVLIVGYPGAMTTVDIKKADFGFIHILLPVSSFSERQLVLADENRTRIFAHQDDFEIDGICLGGLSGSPAFLVKDQRYLFIGIVTECSQRDQTILVSRLGCLDRDGTLDRTCIPW